MEVLAIAMDGQGADRVRPYVEAAGATFTSLIDEEAATGRLYGFKAVGNGFLIERDGTVSYRHSTGFDIRRTEVADLLELWATGSGAPGPAEESLAQAGPPDPEADALYREGLALYRDGKVPDAVGCWRRALEFDPESIIIHRHIWAVENPERFYAGEIDQEWKRRQLDRGL